MRLLKCDNTDSFSFTEDLDSDGVPPYAILSHTWLDGEEVTYEELVEGSNKDKAGYNKIRFLAQQAKRDGLNYFWIDTCCINKNDRAELQDAISLMFSWYQNAARCYVFLSDVSVSDVLTRKRAADGELLQANWETTFRASRWFARGWTLQELLAPKSVEFYSKEWRRLGDKISLKQSIRKATRIPDAALEGGPWSLSQFSVNERLSWSEHRETTLAEDKVYSLIGIFGVQMSPFYGEGAGRALRRLLDEVERLGKCLQDLRLSDPFDDKKRIEYTKGGLLKDAYQWVFNSYNFQQWRKDPYSRLLWIKGDPGKGKTMLLCGIIDELKKSTANLLSYFFCQGMDSRNDNANSVLRGLIYQLVSQQPSLAVYLRKKYDQAGTSIFEDTNAWFVLSDILTSITQDTKVGWIYLVVDALDECVVDLPKLLDLITCTSASSKHVKWLISSRHEAHIEQKLRSIDANAKLNLELKSNAEQVAQAVEVYIDYKLSYLESLHDDSVRDQVREQLRKKANGTFLWVALMVQELGKAETWNPLQILEEAPQDLNLLYDRMMARVRQLKKRDAEICYQLLSTVAVTYRPLYLAEIGSMCGPPQQSPMSAKSTRTIVAMCGSFLTILDDQVYLVHQSAKDYLSSTMQGTVLPLPNKVHEDIFSRSLKLMHRTLKRDMYHLVQPGVSIDSVRVPDPDPLATVRYSCVYWIDHLHQSVLGESDICENLQDNGAVHLFLKSLYLYWLEALSLCKCVSTGTRSIATLNVLTKVIIDYQLAHMIC